MSSPVSTPVRWTGTNQVEVCAALSAYYGGTYTPEVQGNGNLICWGSPPVEIPPGWWHIPGPNGGQTMTDADYQALG